MFIVQYCTLRTVLHTRGVHRIHLILMQIRILDPHWKKWNPDPGPGISLLIFFLTKQNFQFFCLNFSFIFLPKLVEPFEIFMISLFVNSSVLGLKRKQIFFYSFWFIFSPLDPHGSSKPKLCGSKWIQRILSTV